MQMMSLGTNLLLVVDKARAASGILSLVATNLRPPTLLSSHMLVDLRPGTIRIKKKMLDHLSS